MANASARIQDVITVATDMSQFIDRCADVGGFGVINLQTRRIKLPTGGTVTLYFDHSMTLEEESFEPTGFSVTFVSGGASTPVTVTIPNPNRYIRWRASGPGATYPIQFMIDLLGRER